MINSTNLHLNYWFIDFVWLKEYQYFKVVLFTVFVIKLKQQVIIAIEFTSKWYYIDLINFHKTNSNFNWKTDFKYCKLQLMLNWLRRLIVAVKKSNSKLVSSVEQRLIISEFNHF